MHISDRGGPVVERHTEFEPHEYRVVQLGSPKCFFFLLVGKVLNLL